MKELTILLLERIGLLLVIAFVLTRIPNFKALLYREGNKKITIIHAFIFGLFAIAGTHLGFVFEQGEGFRHGFIWSVKPDQMVISLSLIAVVIAGLLGGPGVGLGAGMIAGIHLGFLGGVGWLANVFVNPMTGLLAGLTGRFFSKARVISPIQALFIGVFPPILHMQILLILYPHHEQMLDFVNVAGLPLVLSNSIAIAVFTAMIGVVLKEQENEAAFATKQALTIAEEALPLLKSGTLRDQADGLAHLLFERLHVAAISIMSQKEVLAFKGLGADYHNGQLQLTPLLKNALETKQIQTAYTKSELSCVHPECPLEAAIIIPVIEPNDTTSLINLYFRKPQHIRPVELMLAQGIRQLISKQLKVVASENLQASIRDAELRNLQAQINPHFLFNTLHLIATLFRIDPNCARHITIQLANFMRFNLGIASESLISLEREWEHVKAYIEIIQARFSNRIHIQFHSYRIPSHVLIPPSTIQPLVENSVQHGLKNVKENGRIIISVQAKGEWLEISVEDNGIGFSSEQIKRSSWLSNPKKTHQGVGLNNVNQRLIGLLGERSRLHIENLPTRGSKVYFTIPMETREKPT